MRARGTRLLLGALALPLLIGATFTGTQVRDQDAVTMERGLSRVELSSLRSFRSLESLWILVAPSRAEWDEDVAPELAEALAKPPSQFRTWASFLPPTIGRAGPDVSGGLLHVELPDGRGKGVLAVWMPPLINDGRQGTALLNSPEPNRGRFLSGVEVGRAPEGAERVMRGLFLPSWPRALGR